MNIQEKFWIAEKDGEIEIVSFRLSLGIKPKLPKYNFTGPFDTRLLAKKHIERMKND